MLLSSVCDPPTLIWSLLVVLSVLNLILRKLQTDKVNLRNLKLFQVKSEIKQLRSQAEKLNTPSTYAKSAKYERLAQQKEKELAGLDEQKPSSLHEPILRFAKFAKGATYVAAIGACYGTVISTFPRRSAFPMSFMWSFMSSSGSKEIVALSVFGWLVCCDRASSAVMKALIREQFPKPRAVHQD